MKINKRVLAKSLTWRAVSVLATYILAICLGLTEQTTLLFIFLEIVVFTALFYVHEAIWSYYEKK